MKLIRSGSVALVGRPNVGKSTLLNAALEQSLAIVSSTPQTTRETLLGVIHHRDTEICLLDTPGLHRPEHALGRAMNRSARVAAKDADVIVFVTDLPERLTRERLPRPHRGDITLLADLPEGTPVLLVVNKIDRVRDKALVLPLLEALAKLGSFASIVPLSAKTADGVKTLLDEVAALCPEGPAQHEPDMLTDRPMRFFASEYIREQVLMALYQEVPHAIAVTIDEFEDGERGLAHISATIHVEREGQKGIVIGKAGAMLKKIGMGARARIEELLERQINLVLFVRVTDGWRGSPSKLADLGYSEAAELKKKPVEKPKAAASGKPSTKPKPDKATEKKSATKSKKAPATKKPQPRKNRPKLASSTRGKPLASGRGTSRTRSR